MKVRPELLRKHHFAPDSSATDRPGKVVGCVLCPLLEDNQIHQDVPEDDSDRIIGEGEAIDGRS